MLGREARLARFLWRAPMLFLRGLLIPVGSDRVPLPRKGRRPVGRNPGLSGFFTSLADVSVAMGTSAGGKVCFSVLSQEGEGGEVWAAPLLEGREPRSCPGSFPSGDTHPTHQYLPLPRFSMCLSPGKPVLGPALVPLPSEAALSPSSASIASFPGQTWKW